MGQILASWMRAPELYHALIHTQIATRRKRILESNITLSDYPINFAHRIIITEKDSNNPEIVISRITNHEKTNGNHQMTTDNYKINIDRSIINEKDRE